MIKDILDTDATAVDAAELAMPESVRTPGRTWTEISFDEKAHGSGSLTVDCDDDRVEVVSLDMAYDQYPEQVKQVLFGGVSPDDNRIAALHANLVEDTVFVRIPEGATVEDEIEIVSSADDGFYPHHVVVYAEDGAVAQVVERNTGNGQSDSSFTEVYVGAQANVQYAKVNDLNTGLGYAESFAYVAENGVFDWLLVSTGADMYRNRLKTNLAGPRSELAYHLGFLAADEQHMDVTTHVVHNADNTRCDMESRGATLDASRAVYKGVQEVKQNAEGTKSFQNEQTIMVGEDCEADTTPQLQIDNNDVEATHAATTGHIDEADLFYMKSRGLHEADAKREIITGMFDDLIDAQRVDAGAQTIHAKISETLGH